MTATELRFNLLKKIENLDGKNLEEVYGLILNFLNKKRKPESSKMTHYEKTMIEEGLGELNEGKGIAHEEVMNKYRRKYRK